jgi:hypothetical protein
MTMTPRLMSLRLLQIQQHRPRMTPQPLSWRRLQQPQPQNHHPEELFARTFISRRLKTIDFYHALLACRRLAFSSGGLTLFANCRSFYHALPHNSCILLELLASGVWDHISTSQLYILFFFLHSPLLFA